MRTLSGKPIAIGQDARWRGGWLSFWKDRFFVSITNCQA
jgi:hypothetical protein